MAIFEIYGQQKTLTQWDVGRKLIAQEACTHVHYANAAMTEAIVCEVTESNGVRTAVIPDEVLQVSGTLRVYAFLDGAEGYTKHIQTFFVKAKPKPADYVYTPTEWMTMEELAERIGALEGEEESDPTVPGWAKQPQKPAYTAQEVGARPASWMPTAAEVGARPASWMPTAAEVGARADTWLPGVAEIGAAPAKKAVKNLLSTAEWYRVGAVNAYNCYRITISTIWGNYADVAAIIDVCASLANPVLTKTSVAFSRSWEKAVDQVRLIQNGNKYYVDIHWQYSEDQYCYVLMDGPEGWFTPWDEWTALGEDGATAAVTLAL